LGATHRQEGCHLWQPISQSVGAIYTYELSSVKGFVQQDPLNVYSLPGGTPYDAER